MRKTKRIALKSIEVAWYVTVAVLTVGAMIGSIAYAYNTQGGIFTTGFICGLMVGLLLMLVLVAISFMNASVTANEYYEKMNGRSN